MIRGAVINASKGWGRSVSVAAATRSSRKRPLVRHSSSNGGKKPEDRINTSSYRVPEPADKALDAKIDMYREMGKRNARHAPTKFSEPERMSDATHFTYILEGEGSSLAGRSEIAPLTSNMASVHEATRHRTMRYNTFIIPRMVAFPTFAQCQSRALAAALPMVGFGFMDNLIMIQAGDLIDNTIGVTLGFAALTSAAFGQVRDSLTHAHTISPVAADPPVSPQHNPKIFSDVSGICFGGVVEAAANRMGLGESGITADQEKLRGVKILSTVSAACGVIVGCLLGMTSLLCMDLGAADRKKMQEELRPLFETMMTDGARSVGAHNCTLWILDKDGKHLWSKVQQGAPPDEKKLKNMFDGFVADTDHAAEKERYITAGDLETALTKLGWNLSHKKTAELIKKANAEDGVLRYEQFCLLMTNFLLNSAEEVSLLADAYPLRNHVLQSKQTLNCSAAEIEPCYMKNMNMDLFTGADAVQTLLIAPVLGDGGTVLGLIEFVNKLPTDRPSAGEGNAAVPMAEWDLFSEDDEKVIRLICAHTATFIKQLQE